MSQSLMWLLSLVLLWGAVAPARAWAADDVQGTVAARLGLNLRAGPGLGYRVLAVLKDGTTLSLIGRSADSQWLNVTLADGRGGWVFAGYVDTDANLAGLAITEASGGPIERPLASTRFDLSMTIDGNLATVLLQHYPANAEVVITLSPAGGSNGVEVARATTSADGAARIVFAMPARWADGQPVVESNLLLVAATTDGAFSRHASIVYFS